MRAFIGLGGVVWVALLIASSGCASGEDQAAADAVVQKFLVALTTHDRHGLIDVGIYNMADEPENQRKRFDGHAAVLSAAIGELRSAKLVGAQVLSFVGGRQGSTAEMIYELTGTKGGAELRVKAEKKREWQIAAFAFRVAAPAASPTTAPPAGSSGAQ